MQKPIPDWVIQAVWFAAGICATGAFWYFLSQKDIAFTVGAGVGAVAFAAVAIALHMRKDGASSRDGKEVLLKVDGETVTCTELLRSVLHDVVVIHGHDHVLGVTAEYEWLKRNYPDGKRVKQALTSLDLLKGKKNRKDSKIYFDVLTIRFADGREKKVYFDISSFFSGGISSILQPDDLIVRKLGTLYE